MKKAFLCLFISYCVLAFITLEFYILDWQPAGRLALLLLAIFIWFFNRFSGLDSDTTQQPISKRITPTLGDKDE